MLCIAPGFSFTPFPSFSDYLQNRDLLPFDSFTCNTPLRLAPRLR